MNTQEATAPAADRIAPGQQVITINPDGSVEGLQYRAGKGLDLRTLGRADIVRVSEVLFDPSRQLWHVEFRAAGLYSGKPLTVSLLHRARGLPEPETGGDEPAYFEEYEEGVCAEIDTLNHLRLTDADALRQETQAG